MQFAVCLQSSRRNVTNLRMELVTSSETFKQFDRVLTDVTYRNVCVVVCVTTARTAATTTTIMYNSFYLLCTGHISHDPFLHRIPFNVSFMRCVHSLHRLSSQIIEVCKRHATKRTPYSLESEISVWSQVSDVRYKQKLIGHLCWTFEWITRGSLYQRTSGYLLRFGNPQQCKEQHQLVAWICTTRSLRVFNITLNNSVITSQKTHCAFISKITFLTVVTKNMGMWEMPNRKARSKAQKGCRTEVINS
jgi:hypothetical protein